MSTTSKASGADGFFSKIGSGLSSGIAKFSEEYLPIWAANELISQQKDTTAQSTFNPAVAPPRIDNTGGSTGPAPVTSQAPPSAGGLSTNTLLLAGGGLLLFLLFGFALLRGK